MNIQIRVMSAQAMAEFAKLNAAQKSFIASGRVANTAAAMGGATTGLMALEKWGNKAQWAGRQLSYNFTMPLMLAAAAGGKFALDNEAAMVRMQKVYGEGARDAKFYEKEITSLGKAFEMLSNQYGIARADVINIAADWAAAGSSGLALAKATKLTMDAMILGEMNAADATKALIAIQAQYSLSTDDLSKTIDTLNMVENQTGITMEGLITGMARAAGTARDAGIDVRHLSAMLAAMVPAAGTASQAGNAIKTMISRLLSPTKEAAEVMGMFGVNTADMGWNSMNAVQRLDAMSKSFEKLTGPQKAIASATIASRFQINKFSTLMRDMINPLGYYQRSLRATANETANFDQKTKELAQVLESNPRKLQIIWVNLQNMMANVVAPMLPYIVSLAAGFVSLMKGFQNLNPAVQKLILAFLLFMALLGPVLKYLGSLFTVVGYLGNGLKTAGGYIGWFVKQLIALAFAPFKLIAVGLWTIGSMAVSMSMSILNAFGLQAAVVVFKRMMGTLVVIAASGFYSMVAYAANAMLLIAARFLASGPVIAAVGFLSNAVGVIWAAGLSAMIALQKAFVPMMLALWGWMQTGMIAIQKAFTVASIALWGFMQTSIMTLVKAFAFAVGVAWGFMMQALLAITKAFSFLIGVAWGFMQSSIIALTKAFSFLVGVVWGFMHAALLAGTKAWGIVMRGLWAATLSGLMLLVRVFSFTIGVAWGLMFVTLRTITFLGLNAIGIAWVISTKLLAITVKTLTVTLSAIWFFMHEAMMAISVIFSFNIRVLWTVLMMTLGAIVSGGFKMIVMGVVKMAGVLFAALTSPWGLAIAAILLLVSIFRKQIAAAWNGVVAWFQTAIPRIGLAFQPLTQVFGNAVDFIKRAFWSLPAGIQGAFLTVVAIVRKAAMAVYDLFSYFNPFAKHSPSLVDNVSKGMKIVGTEHSSIGAVGGTMDKAASSVQSFKQVTGGVDAVKNNFSAPMVKATGDLQNFQNATSSITPAPFEAQRADMAKALPSALPSMDKLIADLSVLNRLLTSQKAIVDAQQGVVDRWKQSLDAANLALDAETKKLDNLQANLDKLTSAYESHKTAMQGFADAPLAGMRAMNNAIFANSMEQKKLQLAMAQMGDSGSIDKLRDKFAKLQGEIETLRGTREDLRRAGAGSDVLGAYDAQITALEAQQTAVENSTGPISKMQTQLEALQHQAEIMDLQSALRFDPLKKQIADLADATRELTFKEITDGISRERAAMANLQPQIDSATAAVDRQKLAVERMTAARDAISTRYDIESAKLQVLNDNYSATEAQIRAIESALNDMGSAASDAVQKAAAKASAKASAKKAAKDAKNTLTPAGQNYMNAGAADFPEVGGVSGIGREKVGGDLLGDQSGAIDEWMKKNGGDISKAFGKIDMFKPLRDMWDKGWKWMEVNVFPKVSPVVDAIKQTWNDSVAGIFNLGDQEYIGNGATRATTTVSDRLKEGFGKITGTVSDWWNKNISPIIALLAPDFANAWNAISKAGEKIWNELLPAISGAMKELWPIIKVIAQVVGGSLLLAFKVVAGIIGNVLGPALSLIIDIFTSVVTIIKGVAQVIVGLFTMDFGKMADGLYNIFSGLFFGIVDIIKNVGGMIWGAVMGIVNGIIGFFKYLYDVIIGHSIIPDLISGIVDWFKNLGPWVITHIVAFITGAVAWFATLPGKVWKAVVSIVTFLGKIATNAFNSFIDNAKSLWQGAKGVLSWLGGLASSVWEKIKNIPGKLGQAAADAFNGFKKAASDRWSGAKGILVWLGGLATSVWEKVKSVPGKLITAATDAFNGFKKAASDRWSGAKGILVWLGGLATAVWGKVSGIPGKLITAAYNAFKGFLDKAKAMWDGKNGIMTWIGGLAGKVASKMSSIGTTVANAIKGAWNGAAKWINKYGIANVNKVTSKLGFTIPGLPTFAKGGIVPGGQSKRDNMLIAARSGEGVILPETVNAIGGAGGLNMLNQIAKNGGSLMDFMRSSAVGEYAKGGVVGTGDFNIGGLWNSVTGKISDATGAIEGWFQKGIGYALNQIIAPLGGLLRKSIPGNSTMEDFMAGTLDKWAVKAKSWGEAKDKARAVSAAAGTGLSGTASLGGMGWVRQMQVLKARFPEITMNSGYRPGAITARGGLSMHGMGRAVDIPPKMQYFDWIRANYGQATKQLIFSPANGRQILNGKSFMYTEPDRGNHWDHVHWGYDDGGYLKPGVTRAANTSGRPEPVFSAAQWSTVRALVAASTNVLKSSGVAGVGSATGLRGTSLVNAQGRLTRFGARSTTQSQSGSTKTEMHFHGDLTFPSVKTGDDAKSFIRNLESLAG